MCLRNRIQRRKSVSLHTPEQIENENLFKASKIKREKKKKKRIYDKSHDFIWYQSDIS